jgi:hypothetical protein
MRFKIIFFPLAIAICIVVSINLIWPEVTRNRELITEKEGKQKVLDSHSSERNKIETLRKDIEANKNEETTVLSYLPIRKNEESFVNSVNYLATNSSVILTDLSLEERAVSQINAANSNQDVTGSKDVLFSSNSAGVSAQNDVANQTRFINSKIKASGTYQNIKIFLNQLNNMAIFNKVNSIAISKPETTTDNAAKTDLLNVDMDIDFGYKPSVTIRENSALPSFPENPFDFSAIKKIESSSVKVTSITDSGLGSTGRENPFLP